MQTKLVLMSLAALALGGCAGPMATDRADQAFGQSVRQAMALQTLNPGAGRDTALPVLADAQAARNALAKHRDSFKTPPPTFSVIGVTSSSSGQ